jgi:hypothetical protein
MRWALVVVVLAGCTIPDKLCDTVAGDNTCDGDGDCVRAFCAAECDNCRKVYSRKQAERAYCLVIVGDSIPSRCREAYEDLSCDPTPPVCPEEGAEARCVDGECVPVRP